MWGEKAVPKPPTPQETSAPGAALPPPGAAPLGPSLPPMGPASGCTSSPSSPYTTSRSLIHDLTLPSVPCLSIPSSPPPPATPLASCLATSQKFAHFLSLKRQGTHFNAKLSQSSALRNPALTDKLLQYVDMPPPGAGGGGGGRLQYQTTLSAAVWDPAAFPASAFREALRKGRDSVARDKEAQRTAWGRTSVEFVPATTAPAGGGKGDRRKGGWQ
ncbi:HCNGP-like protein [Cordyceps militaris CM01]|uniref:HCNGP-like protein n=1 Tax=Cordyceps militaris (strain CM01) TaxID=983644 RepID=G3JHQ0_CORMM|nr:HCNGP-like protein [Cordyceps militaris CM01]EGX91756.1 HCNGP-like protein [Cordyceps militaris CM01]